MSKIQKIPQKVLDAITPYLMSDEVVELALLQDNKKPKEIWLIKTNQAIILHGQQPDKPMPAIMVLVLDELREIDYLQKNDDIQIIFYSSKNNGKAVFHFEIASAKEIEKFLMDLGDLITFRYQTSAGKISVLQKALPIGNKDRKIFGRGKPKAPSLLMKNRIKTSEAEKKPQENSAVKTNIKESVVSPSNVNSTNKINEASTNKVFKNENKKFIEKKDEILKSPIIEKENTNVGKEKTNIINEPPKVEKEKTNIINKPPKVEKEKTNIVKEPPKVENNKIENKDEKIITKANFNENEIKQSTNSEKSFLIKKTESSKKIVEDDTNINAISSPVLEEKPKIEKNENIESSELKKDDLKDNSSKPKKEIDFGNPIYFIPLTIFATIIGFFCLSFFKAISKITKYFKKR